MAGAPGALRRSLLVLILTVMGCVALLLSAAGLVEARQMVASWYGPGFEGATTASGEPFDPSDYTAAHRTLPFGTKLIVTLDGRSVVVRVNDRGPYIAGRDLDLSQAAAEQIGLTAVGVATVNVTTADPSTPTGPFVGGAPAPQPGPQRAPQPAPEPVPEPVPAPAPEFPAGDARRDVGDATMSQYGRERPAGEAQYAPEAQYVPEAQYTPEAQYAPEAQYGAGTTGEGGVAPQEAAPEVEPPAPSPAQLETPPAELATPGSTVERRIQLGLANPPEGYTGPLPGDPIEVPAPEPETPIESRSSAPDVTGGSGGLAGISVLPDTGGASPVTLARGVVLICLGTLALRRLRR